MFLKIGDNFFRRTDVKLTLWYILTFLLSAILICGFLYFRLRQQLVKEVDRFILDEIKELEDVLAKNPNDKGVLRSFEDHIEVRTLYPIYFRVLKEKGDSFYSSNKFEEIGYVPDDRTWNNVRNGKELRENIRPPGRRRPYRIITTFLPIKDHPGFIIQMGTHLKFVRKSLSNFKNNMLITLPILILLGSLGGWFLARKSLSPIGYIVSRAKNITSENLNERLVSKGTGDEMDDLIQTINGMIARLDASFKRMTEFIADASHELKTPLCALEGEAEVLLSGKRSPEEYQEGLAHILEQFGKMNRMINDLILLSKFDSRQAELKRAPLRLDLLIRDISNLFKVLAEQKNIDLMIETLPEVTLMGDKNRLQQLFANLIDNAIKYTPKGFIQVTLERNERNVIVRIKDTGIGIPREEQENIFKRFYRVDKSRSKETGGVGLGLSIVQWIVHAHQGRIEVQSPPEEGSTFIVTLPIFDPEDRNFQP
jgi:heavy metal sensor kinase